MVKKRSAIKSWAVFMVVSFSLTLVFSRHSNASDVYIKGSEMGQGIALSSGNSCYVVTAFHVVEDAPGSNITLITSDRSEAQATIFRDYGSEIDIAVLHVQSNTTQICQGNKWPLIFDLSRKIEDALLKGNLETLEESGSRRSMSVQIVRYNEHNYIHIRPVSPHDEIVKGMSGGLLVVNGISAGVLTEVNPKTGVGKVVRQDFLNGLLQSLVEKHASIGKVEKLIGQSAIIELYAEVPVGTRIYALTQSGDKIILKVTKVHFNFASAKFSNGPQPLRKGESVYEYELK